MRRTDDVGGETCRVRCVVAGRDLVEVQILIPILPSSSPPCLSHLLSSSPVPRKTDLSTLKGRKKRDHSSSSVVPRLWLEVDASLFSLLVSPSDLSLSPSSLYQLSHACLQKDFYGPLYIEKIHFLNHQ